MSTVTAFIRTLKVGNDQSANVRFRLRDGRSFQVFHKSELSVIPDRWDKQHQRLKSRCHLDERERDAFDTAVNERKALIKGVYLEKGRALTSEMLDTEIDRVLHPEEYEIPAQTVLPFVADFVKTAHTRKDKKTGRVLNARSILRYKATEKHLKAFAKSMKKQDFEFSEINQKFYDKFVEYLQNDLTTAKKGATIVMKERFTQNTVGKHIKVLKTMLNEAQAKGIGTAPGLSAFRAFVEDIDTVYLDENELKHLKNIDLSETPCLDRARDWFLLLAWTGCRFSDLSKIAKTDIKDGFITFRQQKTNHKVTIPLHPVVVEILEKYHYDLPTKISNNTFNESLKNVCKVANLVNPETRTRTVGGRLTTETFEKWQLITSHTGRRSFCTNMYKRGLPTLMIMSVSGHTTERAFLKYIKVTQEEHAKMMAQQWAEMYGTKT